MLFGWSCRSLRLALTFTNSCAAPESLAAQRLWDFFPGPRERSTPAPGPWRRLPLGRAGGPSLLSQVAPKLESVRAAEFPSLLEQGRGLAREPFATGDLQGLEPAVPTGRAEMQHPTAIAEPGVPGEGRSRTSRGHGLAPCQATSGAQPRCRLRSSVQPGQRWLM